MTQQSNKPLTKSMSRFFGEGRDVFYASAPGRLDVMGGIGDYSGSYVLQMPIAERAHVYLAPRRDGVLRARSENAGQAGHHHEAEVHLAPFLKHLKKSFYSNARQILSQNPDTHWAAYIFGCALALIREHNANISGADFWVKSDVPIGKGVSSSAAIEVAAMSALCKAFHVALKGNKLPALAQKVENQIVGAPCGLMDQLAVYHGKQNCLSPILCRPDRVDPAIEIPKGIALIGVDSGARHHVSGSSYTDVRTAAYMGYSIIALCEGATPSELREAKRSGDRTGLPHGGYLAAISPSQFETRYRDLLPEAIGGAQFIKRYGGTIDPITSPHPKRRYAVHDCSMYPVCEHHRVHLFISHLRALNHANQKEREALLSQMGELMLQAHAGYSRCGLGSPATDFLVERAVEAGPENGVYGAKITGGGSGGSVCFLCAGSRGVATVKQIAMQRAAEQGCKPAMFLRNGPGARWGTVLKLKT